MAATAPVNPYVLLRPLMQPDQGLREMAAEQLFDEICDLASAKSGSLDLLLRAVRRLALECPFEDVRLSMQECLAVCEERLGIDGAAIDPDAPLLTVSRFVDMPKLLILAREDAAAARATSASAASAGASTEGKEGGSLPTTRSGSSTAHQGADGESQDLEGTGGEAEDDTEDVTRAKEAVAKLSPPMGLPRQHGLAIRPSLLPILERCYLAFGEIPNCLMVLSQHPAFLSRFVTSLRLVFVDDGALPPPWRAYLGMVAASRHRNKEVTLFMASQFLSHGGDASWLAAGGEEHVPASLRNLSRLNAMLAHQPWALTASDVADAAKDPSAGGSGLSVDQMVQAIVVFVTVHGLCTLCAGASVTPETDAEIALAAIGLPADVVPASKEVSFKLADHLDEEAEAEDAADLLETMQGTRHTRAKGTGPSATHGAVGADSSSGATAAAVGSSHAGAEGVGASATAASAADSASSSTLQLPPLSSYPDDDGIGPSAPKTFAAFTQLVAEKLLGKEAVADKPGSTALVRLIAIRSETPSFEFYRSLGGSSRVCVKLLRHVEQQRARTAPLPEAVDATVAHDTPWGSVFERLAGTCGLDMRYQPHASVDYKPVPAEDFSFGHDTVAVLSRFYPSAAEVLLEEVSVAYNLTYRRLGRYIDVNTAPFRHSAWAYATMLMGIHIENYDFSLTNKLIKKPVKAFVRMALCAPEAVEEAHFELLSQLTNSEKLHTLIIAMEARKQTSLVFGCKAIRDHFA